MQSICIHMGLFLKVSMFRIRVYSKITVHDNDHEDDSGFKACAENIQDNTNDGIDTYKDD